MTLTRKFRPSYPKLFAAEGVRCSKMQYRTGGRVHLQCVRREHGADVRHLFDIMDRDAVVEPGVIETREYATPTALRQMVDRVTFTGSGSCAMGVAVAKFAAGDMGRQMLGTIVDVKPGDAGAWVRRYTDPADVSVWYSIKELELATPDDLTVVARYFLHGQYAETQELRSEIAKAAR